jgi:hypothetical protein
MKTAWTLRILATLVAIVFLLCGAGLLIVHRGLSRLSRLNLQPTPQLQAIEKELQVVKALALSGSFPGRKFDHSSVGSIPVESELVDLRRDITVYESMHGRLPNDFTELASVKFPPNSDKRLAKYAKECRIIGLSVDSCILTCDSWTPPTSEDLVSLVHSFDPQTERFYKVQSHVLLYLPSPTVLTVPPSSQRTASSY